MRSPREISSAGQGALTPSTARLVAKSAVTRIAAATPMTADAAAIAGADDRRTPWANLSVDTEQPAPPAATSQHPSSSSTSTASHARLQATAMRAGASNHVPLQPGLLPERYTADLTHWQSPADLPERRLMVQRIIAMTRSKRLNTAGLGGAGAADGGDRTPSLAKRIELSLYSRAASFNEYRDLNTLRRRLQSLVSLSFHEAAVSRRAALESSGGGAAAAKTLGKRKLRPQASTPFGVSRLLIKRPRHAPAAPATSGVCSFETTFVEGASYHHFQHRSSQQLAARHPHRRHPLTASASLAADASSSSFFLTNEDVLRQIYAFLPGVDTIRSLSVNQFAARVLPACVFSLDVEVRAMQRAFDGASASLLCRFANLARLNIYNAAKPCDLPSGSADAAATSAGPSLHAWGCSELDISHDNAGEDVVKQLAEAIELGACRRLTSLRLVSVFTNTCRGNALHLLCAALVKGSCPELEDLLLGGNGFSDVGTVDVAWLLRVGSLPRLARLDIRRNYIGESGLRRVMAALAAGRCPRLKYLCMGGNIITDNSVAPVVELLSSALCPQMRFLGLEDNFLSARGVHCIIQAAVAGGMMPKLHHVSSDGRADSSTGGSGDAASPAAAIVTAAAA